MKIQHYAIIFIIIILPYSIICKALINNKIDTLNTETRINNAIDTATYDAVDTLVELNDEYYALYEGETLNVTPTIAQAGIDVFFDTFAVNYNIPFISDEEHEELYFSPYIPAVIVIAYDGFYIYSMEETSTGTFEYVLSPKIPYAAQFGDFYINFSLGNYIKLYTPNGMIYEGEFKSDYIDEPEVVAEYDKLYYIFGNSNSAVRKYISQLTTDMSIIAYALDQGGINLPTFLKTKVADGEVSMLNDYEEDRPYNQVSQFNVIRRETIINIIIDTLNEKMNRHNRYADIMGITYEFYLPEIDDAEWINAVDDVSIMAFVQGIPTGTETYYNSYALGTSRIIKRVYLYGTADQLYHKIDCNTLTGQIDDEGYPVTGSSVTEIFINADSAAKNGYYPCMHCKP